jgi:peptidoglycan/LPS O-acetylase OafA/YrhL
MTLTPEPTDPGPAAESTVAARRRVARLAAATLSSVIAVLYALIASGLVTVLDGPTAARDQLAFATPAAVVYLVGAVLLLRFDQRRLWVLGALLQAAVIAQYLNLASEREPPFEPWGIAIRVVQAALLAVLVVLAIGPARQHGSEPHLPA